MTEKIREAVGIVKNDYDSYEDGSEYRKAISLLLDLASAYLAVEEPKEAIYDHDALPEGANDTMVYCQQAHNNMCSGYNQALQDCKLAMLKKLEGITPRRLHSWYLESVATLKKESFNPNADCDFEALTEEQQSIDKYISTAIKDHLLGGKG